VNEKGESDGKYSVSLSFPTEDYTTPQIKETLDKLKAFETRILEDAVNNSEAWFDETLPMAVVKHNFFSFLKYGKDKTTKKTDYNKPPTLRLKVPLYNGKWGVEIYDTQKHLLFPSDNEHITPIDVVQKGSHIACVIQCSGLWFGGKGWGVNWKLVQCVVKRQEIVSIFGSCNVIVSEDDIGKIEDTPTNNTEEDEYVPTPSTPAPSTPTTKKTVVSPPPAPVKPETYVEDSEGEEEEEVATIQEPEPEPEEVAPTPVVKRVIKKAPATEVKEESPSPVAEVKAVKKVVKKK